MYIYATEFGIFNHSDKLTKSDIFNWESIAKQSASLNFPFLAAACPASPTHSQHFTPATIPD